jgi:multidrug efflux pump subunit AcrA (membrane-fusion protein)
VSLDPMYAYFDMDERTLLKIRQAIAEGRITAPASGDLPVLMGLQNEDGFPHKGSINFVNNQVNSTTGSITMRGVFENPRLLAPGTSASAGAAGHSGPSAAAGSSLTHRFIPRLLSPGMFVRIRLPIGQPPKELTGS